MTDTDHTLDPVAVARYNAIHGGHASILLGGSNAVHPDSPTRDPDPADVVTITNALTAEDANWGYDHGFATGDEETTAFARAVRAALAADGWLLPANAREHTELAIRVDEPHPARKEKRGDLITRIPPENARHAPKIWAGWTTVRRTVRTWPGGRWAGPWLPLPTTAETTS